MDAAQLETLKRELGNLDLLTNLAQAEQDLLNTRIAHREQLLAALRQIAQKLQEDQVREAVRNAETLLQAESAALPAPFQAIAAANAEFRKEFEALVTSEKTLAARLQVGFRTVVIEEARAIVS